MKILYYIFGFTFLYIIYWFSPSYFSSVCQAAKKAIDMGEYRIKQDSPGRNCVRDYPDGNYSDCLKDSKLKKIEYILEDNVVSAIYRCETEDGYIGELRITEHLSLDYDEGYDCHYVVFKQDKNIPIGEAAKGYWTP